MRQATFVGNCGLGDLILTCPIAVALLLGYDEVYFPSKEFQLPSVASFFALHPRIKVYVIKNKNGMPTYDPAEYKGDVISPCFPLTPPDKTISFAEYFYAKIHLPYEVRWAYDPIPEAARMVEQLPVPEEDYIFAHHDPSRGFCLRSQYLEGVMLPEADQTKSILRYANIIANAGTIRVIDSSFLHLCESLPTRPDARLEYHKYAKSLEARWGIDHNVPTKKNWTVIE